MTADGELPLAGKLTVRAGGRKVILVKRARESERHVLLKALVFGLYVDRYPELTVEPRIRHRHRPDVVALGPDGRPSFWAECGETGKQKLEHLVRAFPGAHLVVAKQVPNPAPLRGDDSRRVGLGAAVRTGRPRGVPAGCRSLHRRRRRDRRRL